MRLLDTGYKEPVHTLCFQHDGTHIFAAQGRSEGVLRWELASFTAGITLEPKAGRVVSIACSADGLVAVAGSSAEIRVHHARPPFLGVLQAKLRREWYDPFPALAFSPDGRWLFCSQAAGPSQHAFQATVIEVPGGRRLDIQHGWYRPPCQAAFSPDGSRLALAYRAREAHVVSFPSGGRVLTLPHGTKAHMAAYSPDGATLATASPDGIIRVWDAASGRPRARFKGQAKPLHAVAYSPDGRTVAAACGTGAVTMWAVASGRARVALDWGIGAVHSVAFAPDGMRAAAGGLGVVAIWDIDWDD